MKAKELQSLALEKSQEEARTQQELLANQVTRRHCAADAQSRADARPIVGSLAAVSALTSRPLE